mmetsp:Transcript_35690/g.100345  ORF Transcript_35690/g.100345 Transcript_35690/m.100345 type:complete len:202 (+) Transcript_35690:881-1486(+)
MTNAAVEAMQAARTLDRNDPTVIVVVTTKLYWLALVIVSSKRLQYRSLNCITRTRSLPCESPISPRQFSTGDIALFAIRFTWRFVRSCATICMLKMTAERAMTRSITGAIMQITTVRTRRENSMVMLASDMLAREPSTIDRSAPKRDRRRPLGVDSKKDTGACIRWPMQSEWSDFEVAAHASPTDSPSHIMNMMNSSEPAA